jgi:signal transduction histidine kinase
VTRPAFTAAGWTAAGGLAALAHAQRRALARERETVTRAAHELRGALTTISLATHATRVPGTRTPERERAIAVALERARVALADIDGGPATGRPAVERFEARRLVADCVAAARPLAEAHGVALCQRWEGEPGLVVVGERARLGQALANLIANAIEHGGGHVTVRGRAGNGHVRIEVRDDGPGLSASIAVLSRRARSGAGRRGRGLAIVQDIAARHRGQLVAAPATSATGARLELVLPTGEG